MPAPVAPSAILLDALGTLVELRAPWEAFARLAGERHGLRIGVKEARRALLVEMDHYRRACVRAGDGEAVAALRLECAGVLAAELGGEAEAILPADLAATLLDCLEFRLYPDVVPALSAWRARGITLVIASNWDVSLHDVAGRLGLDLLVDGVVTSAEVGHAKPHPALFEAALARAGVSREQALYIGDSVEEDVEGARGVGIDVRLLVRDGLPPALPAGVTAITSLAGL